MRMIFSLGFFFFTAQLFAKNPTGESADYKLDRNRARTSAAIRDGYSTIKIAPEISVSTADKFYPVNIHYKLKILFSGMREGDQTINFKADYFTESFFTQLREKKKYESAWFKMEHLGMGDVKTLEGYLYKSCDHIKITDIKLAPTEAFISLLSALKKAAIKLTLPAQNSVEDVEIEAFITSKIAALGAAKFDISGVLNGSSFAAGFDYVPSI